MDNLSDLPASSDEFTSLVLRYFDRAVSAEEQAALRELLVRSPEHRDAYVLLARQRGELGELMKSEKALEAEATRPSTRRATRRHPSAPGGTNWGFALAAAGILLGLLLYATWSGNPPEGRNEGTAAPRRRAERDRARADDERRRAEARLQEIERRRQTLIPAPQGAGLDENRKKDLDLLAAEKEQVEQELQAAVDRAKKAQDELAGNVPKPIEAPDRTPPPATTENSPAPRSDPLTVSAIARVEEIRGEASIVTNGVRAPAKPGIDLKPGQGIETAEGGRAILRFPDKTRLELASQTTLDQILNDKGKRLVLTRGRVRAEVSKQPKDQPLVFATPHGDLTVLGTTLRVSVEPEPRKGTRLEVEEGKVELRNLAGRSVLVESGHYAVASAGPELVAKLLPIDEIVLLPRHGKISGPEWRRVKDDGATEGMAFETTPAVNLQKPGITDADREKIGKWFAEGRSLSWVTYTFQADAGKEYLVWVRGRCMGAGDRMLQDSVVLDVANGQFVRRPADWFAYPDTLCFFDGYFKFDGYGWSGGAHDPGKTQTPIAVKFARSGTQTIRLHLSEPPMRVDAIWLSVSQTGRPKPEELGTGRDLK